MLMAKLQYQNNRSRYFEFLIDLGADYTLISESDAMLLGIESKDLLGEKINVEVANLQFLEVHKVDLLITIEGVEIDIPVLISKTECECLLGRKGVFDKFDILFKEKNQECVFSKN